jgi:ParB-like chromosome segregation protein Spo0J
MMSNNSEDNFKVIPLANLVKASWNYKVNDEKMALKLMANMRRNGQVESLVVRQISPDRWEIINGNHRYDALAALGSENALCYDVGEVSRQDAIRLAIELNETRFESDQVKLGRMVTDILQSFESNDALATLPFDGKQIARLVEVSSGESWKKNIQEALEAQEKTQEELKKKIIKPADPLVYFKVSKETFVNWLVLKERIQLEYQLSTDAEVLIKILGPETKSKMEEMKNGTAQN